MHKVLSLPLTSWNHIEVKNSQTLIHYPKQYKTESAKIIKAGRKNMRGHRRGGPHWGDGPWAGPFRMKASSLDPPAKQQREATWLMKLNTLCILLRRTFRDFKRIANILDIAFILDLLWYILGKKWVMVKVFYAQSSWVLGAFIEYSVHFFVKHRGSFSERWPLQTLP